MHDVVMRGAWGHMASGCSDLGARARQIEQPFCVLPLEAFCQAIKANVQTQARRPYDLTYLQLVPCV